MLNYASLIASSVALLFFTNAFAGNSTALDLLSKNGFLVTKESSATPFHLTRLQSHSDSSVEYRFGITLSETKSDLVKCSLAGGYKNSNSSLLNKLFFLNSQSWTPLFPESLFPETALKASSALKADLLFDLSQIPTTFQVSKRKKCVDYGTYYDSAGTHQVFCKTYGAEISREISFSTVTLTARNDARIRIQMSCYKETTNTSSTTISAEELSSVLSGIFAL